MTDEKATSGGKPGHAGGPITLAIDHGHFAPRCAGSPHCDGPSFSTCAPYSSGYFCDHVSRLTRVDELRVEVNRILDSFELTDEHPRVNLTHFHSGKDCDDGPPFPCDPESRIACYPGTAAGVYFCVHSIGMPRAGREREIVESIIQAIAAEAERGYPSNGNRSSSQGE